MVWYGLIEVYDRKVEYCDVVQIPGKGRFEYATGKQTRVLGVLLIVCGAEKYYVEFIDEVCIVLRPCVCLFKL